MTHAELQQQVVQLLTTLGWHHLHVRPTVGRGKKWTTSTNIKGWPDLFCFHRNRLGFVAIEIKVHPDCLRPEQYDVMLRLLNSGARYFVVYAAHRNGLAQALAGRSCEHESTLALDDERQHCCDCGEIIAASSVT